MNPSPVASFTLERWPAQPNPCPAMRAVHVLGTTRRHFQLFATTASDPGHEKGLVVICSLPVIEQPDSEIWTGFKPSSYVPRGA